MLTDIVSRTITGANLTKLNQTNTETKDIGPEDIVFGKELFKKIVQSLADSDLSPKATINPHDHAKAKFNFKLGDISIKQKDNDINFILQFQKLGDGIYSVDLICESSKKKIDIKLCQESIKEVSKKIFDAINAELSFLTKSDSQFMTQAAANKEALAHSIRQTPWLLAKVPDGTTINNVPGSTNSSNKIELDKNRQGSETTNYLANLASILSQLGFKNVYH